MPYRDPLVGAQYLREWRRRNRGRYSAYDAARHANERAEKYGAPGRITADEARSILAAGACCYCGSTQVLGLDHVIPLHARGPNRPENLVVACRACNNSKWRSDRPWRWSRHHDCCTECGTTTRRHNAGGLCHNCYMRAWDARTG